jgi:hypothetical protein
MKTPREILFNRHCEAETKLDEIRRNVVGELQTEVPSVASEPDALTVLWQELFVACRWWWRGLGAAWCLILLAVLLGGADEQVGQATQMATAEPMIEAMRERLRMRDELLGLAVVDEAKIAKAEPATGPRSDLFREERYV